MEESNRISRENLVSERRAWVGIDGDVNLVPPASFLPDGGIIRIRFALKNFGHTPATEVRHDIKCFFRTQDTDLHEMWDDFVAGLQRRANAQSGLVIFPSHVIGGVGRHQIVDPEEMRVAITRHLVAQAGRNDLVAVVVFIGIAYKIIGDTGIHVTCQAYADFNLPLGAIAEQEKLLQVRFLTAVID